MSEILYGLADTVQIWRPIAILLLLGVIVVCVALIRAEWGD